MEVLVRVSKITSNDGQELIYIPREIVKRLGYQKGTRILIKVEKETGRIIIEKLMEW